MAIFEADHNQNTHRVRKNATFNRTIHHVPIFEADHNQNTHRVRKNATFNRTIQNMWQFSRQTTIKTHTWPERMLLLTGQYKTCANVQGRPQSKHTKG